MRRIGLLSTIHEEGEGRYRDGSGSASGSHGHDGIDAKDEDGEDGGSQLVFPARILRKRLEIFLQVFSAVTSPKQLYMHNMLYLFYQEIIAKSDAMTVKLAVDCILTYKSPSILPYRDSIKRFLDDKTIRNELLNFDPTLSSKLEDYNSMDDSHEGSHVVVRDEHRDELIPMIVRLVYGRFTSKARGSKAARDLNIARRAAVLSFVSKMQPTEIRHLVHLMLRGLLPLHRLSNASSSSSSIQQQQQPQEKQQQQQHSVVKAVAAVELLSYDSYSTKLQSWYDQIDTFIITHMSPIDLASIPWERSIGFLHLLQPMIRILGFTVTDFVPVIYKVVLMMLTYAQQCRDKVKDLYEKEDVIDDGGDVDDDVDVDVDDDGKKDDQGDDDQTYSNAHHRDASQALRLRSLSLLRIAGT